MRLTEMGGSSVNGWLQRRQCLTVLALSASSNDGESSMQLSLKSLCHIVTTISASRLVCSHLYQLPAPAPNFCLSMWVSIPFVITFHPDVLKRTQDAGDSNHSLQHSEQLGGVTHMLAGPTAVVVIAPSLGSTGHDTHMVSPKVCCWPADGGVEQEECSFIPYRHHSATFTTLGQPRQSPAEHPTASLLAQGWSSTMIGRRWKRCCFHCEQRNRRKYRGDYTEVVAH